MSSRMTVPGSTISPATTVVNETAFGQAAAVGTATTYAREDHTHGTPAAPASTWVSSLLASRTSAITSNTAQQQVIGTTIAANYLTVGMTYRIAGSGIIHTTAAATTITVRIRIGPTSLTGNSPAFLVFTTTTNATDYRFFMDTIFTIRTIGASGTCFADFAFSTMNGASTINENFLQCTAASVAVDTTIDNILELICVNQNIANAANIIFHDAFIQQI